MNLRLVCVALALLSAAPSMTAQTSTSNTTAATAQVPRLVRFSGTVQNLTADMAGGGAVARDGASVPVNTVGVTFSLYSEQTGGAALWSEVQNVQVDKTGHYTVQLGSTQPEGLPVELFSSAQAQWLGVQQEGQAEQPRIMLLSVPYALKAADAETFGGKPPSAYASASPSQTNSTSGANLTAPVSGEAQNAGHPTPHPLPITGSGTTNYVPLWTNASTLSSSAIYQSPTNNFIGIETNDPMYPLHVTDSGNYYALYTYEGKTGGTGIGGFAVSTGVEGQGTSASGIGVFGWAISSTGNTLGVSGQADSTTGIGVKGNATASSGINIGVQGESSSPTGIGVYGKNLVASDITTGVLGIVASPSGVGISGENQATSGNAEGVEAITLSTGGVGAYGEGVQYSNEGLQVHLRPIGVWGDTNQSSGIGVLATADNGIAFSGYNNADNISTAKFFNDETVNETGNILAVQGYMGICVMDVSGNLACTGTKDAVVPVDGGTRKVALYAEESPENWFEDAGSGQLSVGVAVIQLEPLFAQTVNTGVDYHVFLTPNGDCKGLYVTNKTGDSFEVHELGGGKANVSFDYRIMARRKGYESVRLADKTKQFDNAVNEPRPRPGVTPMKVVAPALKAEPRKAAGNPQG